MSTPYLVGCPPGVGDFYWCLTKLRDFKKQRGIEHLRVILQKTSKDRAGELCNMVDFVDSWQYANFRSVKAEATGFLDSGVGGLNAVMWPNALVDKGIHLREWLPQYALELDVPLKVEPCMTAPGRPVIYPSALGVNKAWFPDLGAAFWLKCAERLTELFGAKPILIGASWDHDFSDAVTPACANMLGLTTLPQVAYILQTAPVVIGVASGMTILANRFKTPTIAFFPDKHHAGFPVTWTEADYKPLYQPLRATHLKLEAYSPTAVAEIAYELAKMPRQYAVEAGAFDSAVFGTTK